MGALGAFEMAARRWCLLVALILVSAGVACVAYSQMPASHTATVVDRVAEPVAPPRKATPRPRSRTLILAPPSPPAVAKVDPVALAADVLASVRLTGPENVGAGPGHAPSGAPSVTARLREPGSPEITVRAVAQDPAAARDAAAAASARLGQRLQEIQDERQVPPDGRAVLAPSKPLTMGKPSRTAGIRVFAVTLAFGLLLSVVLAAAVERSARRRRLLLADGAAEPPVRSTDPPVERPLDGPDAGRTGTAVASGDPRRADPEPAPVAGAQRVERGERRSVERGEQGGEAPRVERGERPSVERGERPGSPRPERPAVAEPSGRRPAEPSGSRPAEPSPSTGPGPGPAEDAGPPVSPPLPTRKRRYGPPRPAPGRPVVPARGTTAPLGGRLPGPPMDAPTPPPGGRPNRPPSTGAERPVPSPAPVAPRNRVPGPTGRAPMEPRAPLEQRRPAPPTGARAPQPPGQVRASGPRPRPAAPTAPRPGSPAAARHVARPAWPIAAQLAGRLHPVGPFTGPDPATFDSSALWHPATDPPVSSDRWLPSGPVGATRANG